jgi:hypothetical protein
MITVKNKSGHNWYLFPAVAVSRHYGYAVLRKNLRALFLGETLLEQRPGTLFIEGEGSGEALDQYTVRHASCWSLRVGCQRFDSHNASIIRKWALR